MSIMIHKCMCVCVYLQVISLAMENGTQLHVFKCELLVILHLVSYIITNDLCQIAVNHLDYHLRFMSIQECVAAFPVKLNNDTSRMRKQDQMTKKKNTVKTEREVRQTDTRVEVRVNKGQGAE